MCCVDVGGFGVIDEQDLLVFSDGFHSVGQSLEGGQVVLDGFGGNVHEVGGECGGGDVLGRECADPVVACQGECSVIGQWDGNL